MMGLIDRCGGVRCVMMMGVVVTVMVVLSVLMDRCDGDGCRSDGQVW